MPSDTPLLQLTTLTSKLARAVYDRLGINKVNTCDYHPCTNGGVERVNHVLAQMLSRGSNEQQTDWDALLPHVSLTYNNSTTAATRLAPNEIHIDRLPRVPLSVFKPDNAPTPASASSTASHPIV